MKTQEEIRAYYMGLIEGVHMFAHWRDGVQYVGTTGKTLKEAIKDIESRQEKELKDLQHYG